MARGYAGAFGRAANAPWVWIPLCALFVLPFARRPLRLLHLDLAVLLGVLGLLRVLHAARIDVSVPLVYPLLVYLLARMLVIALARARARAAAAAADRAGGGLGVGALFLLGFRVGLNVVGSNVIDVGYAGVIGADRSAPARRLYGNFPLDNPRGDTYGPVLYEAYVPFEALLGVERRLGRAAGRARRRGRLRPATAGGLWLSAAACAGRSSASLLAYAWAAYPFTLFANTNANDGARRAARDWRRCWRWRARCARGGDRGGRR